MPTGHANRLMPSLRRAVMVRHHAESSDGQLLAAFVGEQDADAFATLVKRHGAMVLGVCRRVVGDAHAAEDAFQAVFIVLARRAAAVRPREGVGNWLYGVAFRTAIKARSVLARRRSREKQVDVMPEPHAPAPADVWSDLQPVIDEELARLPAKLRLPVVLCDLEGRTQRDVARQLNLPVGTLATRLASARRTLAARLSKRGVALSGGALAGVLTSHAAASAVSHRLADAAVRVAEAVAAGDVVSGIASAQAVQLSEGVMRMMLVSKLKAVGVAVVAVFGLTTGLGTGLAPAGADDKKADAKAAKAAPESDAAFLDRVCRDLRGSAATGVEKGYFAADTDAAKRRKLIDWFMADEGTKAYLARKHGAAADHAVTLRVVGSQIAFSPDGEALAVEVSGPGQLELTGDIQLSGKYTLFRRARLDPPPVTTWLPAAQPDDLTLRSWVEFTTPQDPKPVEGFFYAQPDVDVRLWTAVTPESDPDFLKRVVTAARGTDPTALETKYFLDDKDAKKREKLLDALLKEPGVAKKVGDDWKQQMLAGPEAKAARLKYATQFRILLATKQPDRLDMLVGELIEAKKTDAQILEAVTLAVVGRQPSDGEKLTLAAVAKAADRKAAWGEVVKALAATAEAKQYAAELQKRIPPEKK